MSFNIAIDGPAGAGKSTIAKQLAKELSFIYVDTGAMYRSMALYFMRNGIAKEDEAAISDACKTVEVSIAYENGEQQIFERKKCKPRTPERRGRKNGICHQCLFGSAHKSWSAFRESGAGKRCGNGWKRYRNQYAAECAGERSILLPVPNKSQTADIWNCVKKMWTVTLDEIEREIIARDERDMNREIAPLKQAEDAILIDSSDLSIEEVTEKILELCK